jgi:hypothetical protein
MYEIVVDVILTKGELFDYLIGLKDDKLRNGDGIYEEDCDDDRIE